MEFLDIQNKLANYQNEKLIILFQKTRRTKNKTHSLQTFEDLKKLLFIVYLIQEKKVSVRDYRPTEQMHGLEKMWQLFLIMTDDYKNFCEQVFGVYIHHSVEIVNEFENNKSFSDFYNKEQVQLVMDIWGRETVNNWYLPAGIKGKWMKFLVSIFKMDQ